MNEECNIPSNDVRSEPVVAESIFWVIEVVTSTGLPMTFGSDGISRAPLPDGESILSCDCPCVCSDAISRLSILSSFCCTAPANAGSSCLRWPSRRVQSNAVDGLCEGLQTCLEVVKGV